MLRSKMYITVMICRCCFELRAAIEALALPKQSSTAEEPPTKRLAHDALFESLLIV